MTLVRKWTTICLIAFLGAPPGFASWRVNVNPWRERRQDDVASVQVAVQSVAPFDDYVESLQPHYSMDEKTALNEAIALTRTQGTAEFNAVLASVTARGQDVTSTLARETDTDATGEAKTTEKRTESKAPGALSDVAGAPAHVDRNLAAPLPAGDTVIDPSMKYAAATALIQRIALLSNYVRDAAVRMHTKPYLVRLLVTVSPTAATRGYDAYTTVSFFSSSKGPDGEVMPAAGRVSASRFATDSVDREVRAIARLAELEGKHASSASIADAKRAQTEESLNVKVMNAVAEKSCGEEPLETIPLLVTDTVSASLHSDSLERMRELALALQGMTSNARIGAGFRSQNDRLNNTLTRDFNGVMTVSRAAQNSIEVRLGAMFGNRDDALVPRTYDVTALVLFPLAPSQSEGTIRDIVSNEVVPCSMAFYTAQTTFRNSQNGKVARPASLSSLLQKVRDFVANENIAEDIAESLVHAAQEGNYKKFVEAFPSKEKNSATPSLLWPRVVGVVARHSFSRGMFQAPVREVDFFSDQTNGTVFDDGKTSTLMLTGSRNILADRVIGSLKVTPDGGPTFYLAANNVTVGPDGRFAKLTFDSASKHLEKDKKVATVEATVSYAKGARDWEREIYTSEWHPTENGARVPITYVLTAEEKKEPEPSRFSISTGTRTVLATNGSGSIVIALKRGENPDPAVAALPMLFSVEGADIVAAKGLGPIGSDWGSVTDGVWKVDLANLVVGTPVTIKAWSGSGKKRVAEPDIHLLVQALEVREARTITR